VEGQPFIGSEALAAGRLNRHGLRTHYRAVYPDVYVPGQLSLRLDQRTIAAWLWSGRRGVVAGAAAAALHGAKWVPTADVTYYLDMGWPDVMVAAEYDGEHHQVDSLQWRKDIIRLETLARMGWIVIRVVARDRAPEVVWRVRQALQIRGYPPAFIVR